MKKRHRSQRVGNAEWSVLRETSYKRECEDFAYRGGYGIAVRDGIVCKTVRDVETILLRPINPKRVWFETWLVLTDTTEQADP